jgi:hypothetical protein
MLWESGWSHSERRWSLFYSDKASVKNRQKICSGGWVGGNCTELDAHNFGNFVGFTIETPGSCTRLQWIHGKARAKCLFAPSQDAPASCPSSLACTSHVYFTHQFLDGRRWATEKKIQLRLAVSLPSHWCSLVIHFQYILYLLVLYWKE